MYFLKKYFLWIILLVFLAFWAYIKLSDQVPCTVPISYNLGSFDERFKMSKESFLLAVEEANQIWEKAIGKDLFAINPRSDLKINLIYDERQALAERNRDLTETVDTQKESADAVRARFSALQSRYKAAQGEYESLLVQFKKMQDEYSEQVKYWNGRGGAPKSEYDKLNQDKSRLESFQNTLESKRLAINAMADEINGLVKKYNFLVKNVNSTIDTINKDAGKEFEEGEYIYDKEGERINIYEFGNRQVLVRVLVHEFGHALGIDHNNNPDSIMYYLNTSKNMTLTKEDLEALKIACRIE
ncbi:MAG: matrixin family metalloprotease [Patescibacteria group bacterium]